MKLIIVESPGKIKKISSILKNDFLIKASVGHIRDFLRKHNFEVSYLKKENEKLQVCYKYNYQLIIQDCCCRKI